MKLTSKRVERLAKQVGRHPDGHGLYLHVNQSASHRSPSASWILRYERDGRERMYGVGPLSIVGLKEARDRARATRLLLLDGIDPIDERKRKKQQRLIEAAKLVTFSAASKKYFEQQRHKWRNAGHRRQYLHSLEQFAFPIIGDLPIASIDTPMVLKVLEQKVPEEHGGRYPAGPLNVVRAETASRIRGRIESVLDWAKGRGYRNGDNPASRAVIGQVLPSTKKTVQHHAALPYAELPAFMTALRDRSGSAARAPGISHSHSGPAE
jgi:hypothetical protein